jgi:ribosomal protein S18 acetylase RimI-like enzyme
MPGITIRRLGAADAADYRSIRLAALKGAPEAFGSTYEAEAARPLAHFIERVTTCPVFGAYQGPHGHNVIVGMVGYKREEGLRDRHKAFVWGTYVEPAARRRGVARALMEALLQDARREVEQLTLSVVHDNEAARTLYRTLGFEAYGVEPRALKSAAGYADELLMVCFLAPAPGVLQPPAADR